MYFIEVDVHKDFSYVAILDNWDYRLFYADASFLCFASRNDKEREKRFRNWLIDSSWNVVYGIA
jgi:hypothetical protein